MIPGALQRLRELSAMWRNPSPDEIANDLSLGLAAAADELDRVLATVREVSQEHVTSADYCPACSRNYDNAASSRIDQHMRQTAKRLEQFRAEGRAPEPPKEKALDLVRSWIEEDAKLPPEDLPPDLVEARAPHESPAKELIERITNYMGNGGLFNPEMMEHDKVRDLLMDVREHLQAQEARPAPPLDWQRIVRDAAELRSSYGYLLMRLAVAKDAQDAYDVAKKEFEEHEPAMKRLEALPTYGSADWHALPDPPAAVPQALPSPPAAPK